MRLIIGYDGSPNSEAAIDDLVRAGLPPDTEARVVSAPDLLTPHLSHDKGNAPAPMERANAMAERFMADAQQLADAGADRIRKLFPAWKIAAEARPESPHGALVKAAAESAADLIVVGSNGRSALGRLLLGSVSQMVLHNAPCSVRIGRCQAERQRTLDARVRLVVGIDGSSNSATAVSAIAARRWPMGTDVLVLGVLDERVVLNLLKSPPLSARSPRDDTTAQAPVALEESLRSASEELRRAGLTATARLLTGDPKKVLLHEAERAGADCIFVGAKGHGLLGRVLLGSVSGAVAARAACSVEVVRHG